MSRKRPRSLRKGHLERPDQKRRKDEWHDNMSRKQAGIRKGPPKKRSDDAG